PQASGPAGQGRNQLQAGQSEWSRLSEAIGLVLRTAELESAMEWWKSIFRKRALDAQLDSELRFHIEELTEANVAAGLTPEEARRRAVLEFGGREQVKEELRDVHRVSIIESTLANLKSAFRFIRKSPSFSITVIVTLALGIGANSAVFSAIDAILLRPLPFPNGDQLMELRQYNPKTSS